MATITELSDDVIVIILENKTIKMEDIENFMSTCKRFHQITLPKKFWEKKYYQSCPTVKRKYNEEKKNELSRNIDFKGRIEEGLHCIQKIQHYAFVATEKLSYIDKIDLMNLLRSITENSLTYYSVWDEASRIFEQKSSKLFINLTHEYIFNQIFRCLRYFRFIHKQMKFKKMQTSKLLLEKQFTIVAQHFAPHVSYSAVKTWLDEITERALSRLKIKYPSHSICSTALKQFSFWRDNNIDDNFWDETESRQIMSVLEEYIFSELEIDELYELLKLTDFEVNYINNIAECFRKHLLTITYHIIARRLGIRTHLTKYEDSLGVIWKPKYNTRLWVTAEFFYISSNSNLFYPSNIIRTRYQNRFHSSPLIGDIWMTIFTMKKLYTELTRKNHKYCKWNFDYILRFLRQCRKPLRIENKYKNIMNTIEINLNPPEKLLKKRTENVKFAVGMIVRYLKNNSYNHLSYEVINGVIIGWEHGCVINRYFTVPQSFVYHICVCKSSDCRKFYTILTESNDVSRLQDQLSICPPREIDNMEIGKYFSSFEGTHYVPNKYLTNYYPEDIAAIARILAEQ